MAKTLSADEKTIKDFLEVSQKQKILIPEYQRPYSWEEVHISTLFENLVEFTQKKSIDKSQESYFLGTVVYFVNENNKREIIDGQQRLTSLLLFLRVIYEKLSQSEIKSEKGTNFLNQIEPLIWVKDELTGQADKNSIVINSEVISDEQNVSLHNILKTGKTENNAKDNYSKNYELFAKLYDEFLANNSDPDAIFHFINNLLNYTIIIPIEADKKDTALTIFSTLNDRGKPLSDSDIFKSEIYKNLDNDKQKEFIEKWQKIQEKADNADIGMSNLFYMYMFYLRAKNNDKKSTTPKLRTYLSENKYSKLKDNDLLKNLEQILNLLKFNEDLKNIDNENWSNNIQIKQMFEMLKLLDNEWWKYPTIIYYLSHKDKENFENLFLNFLRKLFVNIFQRYSIEHTINSLKSPVLKLNVEILDKTQPTFEFKQIDGHEEKTLEIKIKQPHANLRKALVAFLAYNEEKQKELLPEKWELEHIFPQKWQKTYIEQTVKWLPEKIEEYLWCIGNLIPLSKKTNIEASNKYFDAKKEIYKESEVAIAQKIAETYNDWKPDNIIQRNSEIYQFVQQQFKQWLNQSLAE